MKHILTIFLCLLLATATQAQNTQTNAQCPEYYEAYMKQAADAFTKGDFTTAVDKYSSALAICPQNVAIVKPKMIEVFNRINQLKKDAETAKQTAIAEKEKAKKAQEANEKAERKAQSNLEKANKFVEPIYFSYDRFALVYKKIDSKSKFAFIDKNGDFIDKLGEWDIAKQFSRSFARVALDNYSDPSIYDPSLGYTEYYLDTMGYKFPIAFLVQNLNPEITALDLTLRHLDTLPQQILSNTQLNVLILDHNQLSTLPIGIDSLKNLVHLDLGNNQLSTLPKQMSQLKELAYLELSGNPLINFPAEIFELKHLFYLGLAGSQLIILPSQIGQLENLTELNLFTNELTTLPAEIGKLKKLVRLCVNNKLTALPPEIGQLESLVYLEMGWNDKLTSLPAEFGQLKNLISIQFRGCQLTTLPKEIAGLSNVT